MAPTTSPGTTHETRMPREEKTASRAADSGDSWPMTVDALPVEDDDVVEPREERGNGRG